MRVLRAGSYQGAGARAPSPTSSADQRAIDPRADGIVVRAVVTASRLFQDSLINPAGNGHRSTFPPHVSSVPFVGFLRKFELVQYPNLLNKTTFHLFKTRKVIW